MIKIINQKQKPIAGVVSAAVASLLSLRRVVLVLWTLTQHHARLHGLDILLQLFVFLDLRPELVIEHLPYELIKHALHVLFGSSRRLVVAHAVLGSLRPCRVIVHGRDACRSQQVALVAAQKFG